LPQDEFLGEVVREKLVYYPTVTRESYKHTGRITDLFQLGKLQAAIGLDKLDTAEDRFMMCGRPSMLKDLCLLLDEHGFKETRSGTMGEYVIERAFVES